jgi:hypothetical protein
MRIDGVQVSHIGILARMPPVGISLDRDSGVRVRYNVILRETAEVLAIVFAELRVTLISDPEACLANAD